MYQRCYNEGIHKIKPCYKDCTICEEWLNDKYSFYEWVNDGNFYEIDGESTVHLDKDILVKGNTIYSPETCLFVPASINSLFGGTAPKKDKGLPLGVIQVGECFKPDIAGFRDCFKTVAEAWEIYKLHKKAKIITLADSYAGKIPYKLYKALIDYEIDITD